MMTCVYSVSSRDVDLHLQQLRRAADAAQRVLDLVRQVADEFLVGLGLVDQALLAVLPSLLLQRQQLNNDFIRRLGLRHHHVHLLASPWFGETLEPGVVTQGREFVVRQRRLSAFCSRRAAR